jgi:hypothetical protein
LVFIIYGLGLGLTPIWSLHAALLPLNAWRLVEALGARKLLQHTGFARWTMFSEVQALSDDRIHI